MLPATVTLAPLNVIAVVEPDLSIRLPELLVREPKVTPSSFKKMSPSSASRMIASPASTVRLAEVVIVSALASKTASTSLIAPTIVFA